ncbi:MAG: hypothetical protein J6I35_05625 [Ruminobacter sp.]|uniref:hypothetical protein n=1 Tax=Ruminobacter sp. TaxID=2774296 RepID=UPI001B69DC47|nr:hypothetical protein [Ruminobacter sp.]MBP3749012.1 hypothetical protein [Ruminobacter sp.]
MKIILKDSLNIRDCLRDAGCSDAFSQSCVEYYDNRQYRKVISEIKEKRKVLRQQLQQTQFEIDTLDYLINEIRHKIEYSAANQ